jgi:hypothetical protein
MMMLQKPTLLAFALFLSAGVSAYAGSVNFSFDTQVINGITVTGLTSGQTASGSTSLAIQNYMNAVLTASGCSGCSVTVLVNGSSIGGVADQSYNGDGHVTGPGTGSKSLTLGTSNGATASSSNSTVNSTYDTFISNTNDSSGTVSQQITLQFHNITSLTVNSFDYEVFPDGTCAQLNAANCGGNGNPNQPDLKFEAGNNTNGTDTLQHTFLGVTPNTTNGNATHSPNSGSGSNELAPQAIGTWSGSLAGVSELDFVDWPATIGIDNLTISGSNVNGPNNVPEPASIALFGTLIVLLAKKLRRA